MHPPAHPPAPPRPAPTAASSPAHQRRRWRLLLVLALAIAWLHWQLVQPWAPAARRAGSSGAAAAGASAPASPRRAVVALPPLPRAASPVRDPRAVAAVPAARLAAPPTPSAAADAITLSTVAAAAPDAVPSADAAAEATPPIEIPPTLIPPAQVMVFTAEQGAQQGEATLAWRHDGTSYALTLDAPDWLALRSEGHLDAWGLAPERYTERRRPRSERALTMQRPPGAPGRVAYSSRTAPGPLPPGLQDRLSWLVQLPARVAAQPDASAWTVQVTGPGGDQQVWQLQRLPPPDAERADSMRLIKLRHEPVRPYDSRVEVWLDSAAPHAPRRVMLGAARGETLTLHRPEAPLQPSQSSSTSGASAPK